MRTRVDSQLRAEARRVALRFRCDCCEHYCDTSKSCSHGYPVDLRGVDLEQVSSLEFCKDFELA